MKQFRYRNSGGNVVTMQMFDEDIPLNDEGDVDENWLPEIPGKHEFLTAEENAKLDEQLQIGAKFGDEVKFTKDGKMIPLTKKELAELESKKK